MPWVEESPVDTTWAEPVLGAFQRSAFQPDAFQASSSLEWGEEAEADDTWAEESEL